MTTRGVFVNVKAGEKNGTIEITQKITGKELKNLIVMAKLVDSGKTFRVVLNGKELLENDFISPKDVEFLACLRVAIESEPVKYPPIKLFVVDLKKDKNFRYEFEIKQDEEEVFSSFRKIFNMDEIKDISTVSHVIMCIAQKQEKILSEKKKEDGQELNVQLPSAEKITIGGLDFKKTTIKELKEKIKKEIDARKIKMKEFCFFCDKGQADNDQATLTEYSLETSSLCKVLFHNPKYPLFKNVNIEEKAKEPILNFFKKKKISFDEKKEKLMYCIDFKKVDKPQIALVKFLGGANPLKIYVKDLQITVAEFKDEIIKQGLIVENLYIKNGVARNLDPILLWKGDMFADDFKILSDYGTSVESGAVLDKPTLIYPQKDTAQPLEKALILLKAKLLSLATSLKE